jgi:uncharacterized protein (TIGR00266 family)
LRYEIRYKPAFAAAFITLNPGERITAEAGAMASMDGRLMMTTEFSGGLFSGLMRRLFGGESLFVNVFQNRSSAPAEVVFTQGAIGDIEVLQLKPGEALCFQPGAYIAHAGSVKMSVHWAGFASLFAGEGLFKLKLTGPGLVLFGAYGGISKRQVRGELVVDNGHLVAYNPDISFNLRLSGGFIKSITSGEGIINRLKGNGTIYIQSRSLGGLVRFLSPKVR